MKAAFSLRLPEYIKQPLNDICQKEGVSLNQFIMTAVAEKLSALKTADIIEQRSNMASKNKFLDALSHVPNTKPEKFDML